MLRDQTDIERESLANYVLERLDDLKAEINGLFEAIESPYEPRSPEVIPSGGLSSIEAIGTAIFAAERVWR